MKSSVLLIHPKHPSPVNIIPLGIAYIASVLKKEGIRVQALDLCVEQVSDDTLKRLLQDGEVSVVGITSTTPQIYEAWAIAQRLKEIDRSLLIILGGVHPTVMSEESIGKAGIDVVVRGEGEYTFLELVRHKDDYAGGSEWKKIPGIMFKQPDGQIVNTGHNSTINDLDLLPFPARYLFPFPHKYSSVGQVERIFTDILTSRGCPSHCLFCSNKDVFGDVFRARSPENIVDEIEYLLRKYGIGEIHISDDTFTYDPSRVMTFCDLMHKRRINIPWACGNGIRVDNVTKELLSTMKAAGCYRVGLGIESGNIEIQRRLGKGISLEQVRNTVEIARNVGITTVGFYMIGNLGETEKTVMETIRFACSLPTDYAQFTIMTPYPGTPIYRYLEKKGWIYDSDWSHYGIYHDPVFETPSLSSTDMKKLYGKAYRSFYINTRFIIRKLVHPKKSDFKMVLEGIKLLLPRMRGSSNY